MFFSRCLETELSVVNREVDQLLSTFSSSVVVFENKSFLASLSVKQVWIPTAILHVHVTKVFC